MLNHWPYDEVDAIVMTDGSWILGLGDLGVNGIGIPMGKLDLYVAAGGFHPKKVLPLIIDVGTNNETLLNTPNYLGLKHKRIEGEEYYDFVDEVIASLSLKWPKALI